MAPGKGFLPFVRELLSISTVAEISRLAVSVSAAPVTHQDLGHATYAVRVRSIGWPVSAFADQKIFSSMPCPKGLSNLMVVNQPQAGSRHGQ
jgi:hypothetical protein